MLSVVLCVRLLGFSLAKIPDRPTTYLESYKFEVRQQHYMNFKWNWLLFSRESYQVYDIVSATLLLLPGDFVLVLEWEQVQNWNEIWIFCNLFCSCSNWTAWINECCYTDWLNYCKHYGLPICPFWDLENWIFGELFAELELYFGRLLPWVTLTPRAVTVQLLPQASSITVWKVSVSVRLLEGDTF